TQDKILRFDPKWEADMHLEGITSLSAMAREIGENRVNPLDRERFYEKQLPSILTSNFLLGQHRVCFEYRMRVGDKGYLWFEVRINLSEDALTGDITMSVYLRNIDREKKNVLRSVLEHSQYERILERSALIYELNITQDTMVYTRETLGDEYTLYSGANFFEAVLPRILDTIHDHDKAAVRSLFSKNARLAAYQRGETDLGVDYRRLNKSGDYRWFHCSLQFFCDPQTNDVIAYAYIEDIHDQKEKERRLIFRAQHDMMTGFYNKDIAAEKIEEYLSSEEGKIGTHAFFIVDLDHFKRFNDIFGHAFGDAVLSQTSSKINTLFRSDDILGRIGGDEFIILMKNVKSVDSISVKARELCDSISDIYEEGGMEFRATVSLGIAISGKHGNCFAELYRHSDTALYASKERGRNRYTIYREEMQEGQTTVKNIDERIILKTATLERDISEYVFRILYEAEDIEQGIHGVMALFGKQYQISRISVFENTEDNSCGENTFHWCAENNPNWEKVRPYFFYGKFPEFSEPLIRDGVVVLKETDNLSSELLEEMRRENTKSTVILSMMKRGKFRGFVAFDQCDFPVAPDNEQLNDYRNFANVLGLFIMEMRFEQRVKIAFGGEVRPY
ncbi:MAG: sensor domain-containing diguanylate cyclase, partial [Oscillospiraceae bacterium]